MSCLDEVLIADPAIRQVQCWHREEDDYVRALSSTLLAVSAQQPTQAIAWP